MTLKATLVYYQRTAVACVTWWQTLVCVGGVEAGVAQSWCLALLEE